MMEVWKDVPGYEGIYRACEDGRIVRCGTGKTMKHITQNRGYFRVPLCRDGEKKWFLVHRVIAATFLGERPDGYEVNHKDGNKANNSVSNLEYLTHAENQKHAGEKGLMAHGERRPESRFTEAQVVLMHEAFRRGYSARLIAKQYGADTFSVNKILRGESWRHVARRLGVNCA